jgi:hypothetical protein
MNEKEWKSERLGKFSASEIGKLMVKGRSKDQYFGDGAITYIESRAAEIFNQLPVTDLDGMKAIEWGNTYEHEAAAAFAEHLKLGIEYYGKSNPKFYPYEPVKQWAGGSPDGIVPRLRSVFEIKCPEVSTHHIKYWRIKEGADLKDVKPLYYGQLQFNMMCTGFKNGYFVSYDPRPLSREVKLKVLMVPYDAAYCKELDERLKKAVALLREIIFTDVLGNPPVMIASHDKEVNATVVQDANALIV